MARELVDVALEYEWVRNGQLDADIIGWDELWNTEPGAVLRWWQDDLTGKNTLELVRREEVEGHWLALVLWVKFGGENYPQQLKEFWLDLDYRHVMLRRAVTQSDGGRYG